MLLKISLIIILVLSIGIIGIQESFAEEEAGIVVHLEGVINYPHLEHNLRNPLNNFFTDDITLDFIINRHEISNSLFILKEGTMIISSTNDDKIFNLKPDEFGFGVFHYGGDNNKMLLNFTIEEVGHFILIGTFSELQNQDGILLIEMEGIRIADKHKFKNIFMTGSLIS